MLASALLVAALLAALTAPAAAAPAIQDLATTTIDVSIPVPGEADTVPSEADMAPIDDPSHVTVTVSRLDELIDDSTGDLLAARIVDVDFQFDIRPEDALLPVMVNSVPVALGVSKVSVQTTMVANAAIADVLPLELIEMAFDVGMAVVDVTATEEFKTLVRTDLVADPASVMSADQVGALPDLIEVRRITVRVHVSEINGVQVEQIDIVEQVMDVIAEGYILHAAPTTIPATDDPAELSAMEARREAHRRACMGHHRVAALWSRLPHTTRVALAAFFASLLILVFFVALPLAAYVHWKERSEGYTRVAAYEAGTRLPTIDEESDDEVAQVSRSDEKAWLRANEHYQVVARE